MKARTREFLYYLLWTADGLYRPSLRDLTDTFEAWAYRKGFARQLAELERRKFLENHSTGSSQRLYRLSEVGRLHALGGRDPVERWSRPWDEQWHLVLFDVPRDHPLQRHHLRSYLRKRQFGCLQGSVWVSPDPLDTEADFLRNTAANVNSLLLLQGRPCAGETDEQIVRGAWDFQTINLRYTRYLKVLDRFPRQAARDKTAADSMRQWLNEERLAWHEAVEADPLLPGKLLPLDYLGRRAWNKRIKVLIEVGKQIRDWKL